MPTSALSIAWAGIRGSESPEGYRYRQTTTMPGLPATTCAMNAPEERVVADVTGRAGVQEGGGG